jgi:hypothetical protein
MQRTRRGSLWCMLGPRGEAKTVEQRPWFATGVGKASVTERGTKQIHVQPHRWNRNRWSLRRGRSLLNIRNLVSVGTQKEICYVPLQELMTVFSRTCFQLFSVPSATKYLARSPRVRAASCWSRAERSFRACCSEKVSVCHNKSLNMKASKRLR